MLQERYINPYTDFGFTKLFEQAEIARFTPKERQDYEESIKVYRDLTNVVRTAERKGREAGLAEGRAEERMVNARSLKENGVPMAIILKSLGLTPDEAASLET